MAVTDFQRRKMRRLFEVLDHNRDGVLEEADFTRRVDVFARRRGWSAETEEFQAHLDFSRGEWESLRRFADTDGDGRVTIREFEAFLASLLRDERNAESYAFTDALLVFKAMDADDDGRITAAEYRAYLAIYGLEDARADHFFERMDRDGDGLLALDEMLEASRDFFLSSDPEAPGNFLYGPLE